MVVNALLVVMVFGDVAGLKFEDFEVEVLNRMDGTLTLVGAWNW